MGARRQNVMVMLVMLPMWMNFLLRTYAWMTLLEDNGDHAPVDFGQHGVQRQDHVGNIVVDHPQDHRPRGIDHVQKSEYSGVFGDYSTFSDEMEEDRTASEEANIREEGGCSCRSRCPGSGSCAPRPSRNSPPA